MMLVHILLMMEQGRSRDFSLGAQVDRGAEGLGSGEGAVPPPQKIFLKLYIKMVSSGAFWVAVSYCLAACFIPEKYVWI